MEPVAALSLFAGAIGTITGTCGLILSILNFNRDKPNIQITLKWDMSPYGLVTTTYDENKLWGVVSITNVGRRPIFFSHLHLELPGATEYLLVSAERKGVKL
jgi:hypothetical protein